MGQKIHPVGLRVGLHRKWTNTWVSFSKEYTPSFNYQLQVEKMLKCFFYYYKFTKINTTKKVFLVDAKIYKNGPRQIFLFVFFYKMISKRRKNFVLKSK